MPEFASLLERDMEGIRSPEFGIADVQRRQARRQRDQRLLAGGVGLAIAIALVAAIVVASRTDHVPAKQPPNRGIFTGAAGSIVFGGTYPHQDGVWAIDPDVPGTQFSEPTALPGISGRAVPLAWSKDGTELLVLRPPADPHGSRTYRSGSWVPTVVHADGSLTALPWAQAPGFWGAGAVSFTPDGRSVIATCVRTSNKPYPIPLCIGSVEGGGPQRFASVAGSEPSVSPDGRQIAFLMYPKHSDHLVVMNADGSGKHDLKEPGRYVESITWSPDGSHLAFNATNPGGGLYVIGADGTGLRLLSKGHVSHLSWSSDGTEIAFETGNGGIAVIDADGTGLHHLLYINPPWPWPPSWPPVEPGPWASR